MRILVLVHSCSSEPQHTSFARNIAVKSREDKIAVGKLLGPAIPQNKVAQSLRHGRALLPLHSIFVGLSGGTARGTDGLELKERVVCEQEDESLAHRSGGTEDTCLKSV